MFMTETCMFRLVLGKQLR